MVRKVDLEATLPGPLPLTTATVKLVHTSVFPFPPWYNGNVHGTSYPVGV